MCYVSFKTSGNAFVERKYSNEFYSVFLGFLVLITVAKAQVFEDGGLWNLKIGQSVIIKNKEFSSGYQFGSRRQYTVRGPAFSKIQIQCDISIGVNANAMFSNLELQFLFPHSLVWQSTMYNLQWNVFPYRWY